MMSSGSLRHLVFVYGTLKRDQPNHFHLADPKQGFAEYVGKAQTTNKFPLVVATDYNIPYMLLKEGLGNHVEGEVYQVDDKMLSHLDVLERHPEVYRREQTDICVQQDREGNLLDSPKTELCWVYFLPDFKKDLLTLKFLKSYYDLSEEHGRYVPKEQRTTDLVKSQVKENS